MTKKKKPGKERTVSDKPTELKDNFLKLHDLDRQSLWAERLMSMSRSLSTPIMRPTINAMAASTVLPQFATMAERSKEERRLSAEIDKLKTEVLERSNELLKEKKHTETWKHLVVMLDKMVTKLQTKERLRFVLDRIEGEPRQLLLKSEGFQDKFLKESACYSFVMSVDIRRSTELMLKARTPALYAEFINELCGRLRDTILKHHGVYDKFTGDGILAFFPDFYSGRDAGYYALKCADEAHGIFEEFYYENRKCFTAVLKDVGLGIGLDSGETHWVRLGEGLTVVGTPVVYACRMSGAPAGKTFLNQPAFEGIEEKYKDYCDMKETEIEVKHEGAHVAYCVRLNKLEYEPEPPAWHSFREGKPAAEAPGDNSAEEVK
jgi:class 3 adenylate cyclase